MRSYDNQPSGAVNELRRLRRQAPEPERRLLRALRESFPHLKWRHQAPIGPYKADVLCFSERLVIEVDGDTHANTAAYDAARTCLIEREGYRVLRFTNADVMQNVEGVIAQLSLPLRKGEGAAKRRKGEGDRSAEGLAS
ncbi:endonuclease domain-containing protein [Sphingomonas sp.]|uniref:endonuclease domain-containing protein n=1 Tax=Sphingomonas sp. TaxID=28214 RepID=UPI0035BBC6D5